MKIYLLATCVAALLATSMSAMAQPGYYRGGPPPRIAVCQGRYPGAHVSMHRPGIGWVRGRCVRVRHHLEFRG